VEVEVVVKENVPGRSRWGGVKNITVSSRHILLINVLGDYVCVKVGLY
jgi:hypothetical protein